MAVRKNYNVGVHVEGIGGVAGSTAADGTLFTYAREPTSTPDHDWELFQILDEKPDVLSSSVTIWDTSYDVAEASLKLLSREALTTTITPQDPKATEHDVFQDATDTDSTIKISGPQLPEGFHFIGDETIEVTGVVGSGTDFIEYNINRSRAMSVAQPHPAGQLVFTRPPNLRGRLVRVYLLEEGVAEDTLWTAIIDGYAGDTTLVDIHGTETLHTLKDAELGDDQAVFTTDIGGYLHAYPQRFDGQFYFDAPSVSWDQGWIDPGTGLTQETVVQIDEHLCRARRAGEAATGERFLYLRDTPDDKLFSQYTGPWDIDGDDNSLTDYEVVDESVYEVFVHSPEFSHFEAVPEGGYTWYTDSDHGELYRNHVLSQWLGFATSTGNHGQADQNGPTDVFSAEWGAGLPQSAIDFQAFRDIIHKHPGDTADHPYVLGWDNEPFEFWDWSKEVLLRAFNYIITPGKDGLLQPTKIRRIETVDGAELVDARASTIIAPDDLEWDYQIEKARLRLQGTWGQTPFFEGRQVNAKNANTRGEYLLRDSDQEYRYDVYPTQQEAQEDLDQKLDFRESLPLVIECDCLAEHTRVTPEGVQGGETPGLGDWVRLLGGGTRGIPGPDGTLYNFDDDAVQSVGMIVSREVNLDDWTVSLVLLMFNWRSPKPVRVVAPAAELTGTTGTDSDGRPYVEYAGTFPSSRDATQPGFQAGDDVLLQQTNGRRWYPDEMREIVEVDGLRGFIFLDQQFTDVQQGLEMHLVDEPQFANTSWDGASYFPDDIADRRYAYIGVSQEDPDIYGR